MFFLLRMAFWLGIVCLLLPSGGSQSTSSNAQVNAREAITLASAAVTDMRGFCNRQPKACVAGSKVASALGHRAETGARTLYRLISAQFGNITASIPARKPAAKVIASSASGHGTLTSSDLKPTWHAAVPLPPRRPIIRPAA